MFLLDLKFWILRKVSVCPRGHLAVLFRLAKFLLEAFDTSIHTTNEHLKNKEDM